MLLDDTPEPDPGSQTPCSARGPLLVLTAGLVFHVLGNCLWTLESPLPVPIHNLHDHLNMLAEANRQLMDGVWETVWRFWTTQYYPPLLYLFGSWLSNALDSHWYAVYIPGGLSLLLIGLASYLAGSALFDRRTGALAGVMAASAPIVVGMSRSFDVPLPGAALATMAIGLALHSRAFTRPVVTLAAFLFAALAVLTNRVTPGIPIIPVFLYLIWIGRKKGDGRLGLIAGVVLFSFLAAPFYIPWVAKWVWTAVGWDRVMGDANSAHWTSLKSWLYYLLVLPDNQLHLPLACAFLASLPALWQTGRHERRILLLWWLVPTLVFTFIPKKDPAYTLNNVPVFAVIAAWGLRRGAGQAAKDFEGFKQESPALGPPIPPPLALPAAQETPLLASSTDAAALPPELARPRPREAMYRWLSVRKVVWGLAPALVIVLMLGDTVVSSWSRTSDLLATDWVYSVFPAAQWMRRPIGGNPEITFVVQVLDDIRDRAGPDSEIRIGDMADWEHSAPASPVDSPQARTFWRAYRYRATIPYVVELHDPRVQVFSTLWPWIHEWEALIQHFDKIDYLFFTTSGETTWPDGRTLGVIRERFLPLLPPHLAQQSWEHIGRVIRARDQFELVAQHHVGRMDYEMLVYRRVAPSPEPPLPPPGSEPAQPR